MPITTATEDTSDYPAEEASEDTGTPDVESDVESTEAEDSTTSALLPKSLAIEGVKVGDTITLKVEKVMDEEIQVCPVEEDSEEDAGMKESMSKLDSMAMGGE